MAKTRAIVKRRKAIRNIRKITRTMELIATARYKKAMDRAIAGGPFAARIAELVQTLAGSEAASEHPLLATRPVEKSLLLMLSSNRGLCGGYNANVFRTAHKYYTAAEKPMTLEVSGKRGAAFLRFRGITPAKAYTHFEDKPTFEQVAEVAEHYLAAFTKKEIDQVSVAYTRFVSISRQEAEVVTLLPMALPAAAEGDAKKQKLEFEFIPSLADILDELLPMAFKVWLLKCFLDAAVSEQLARMVAMKGATENAGDLIKKLTRQYNRARQSHITNELLEIIGTAEALK